MELVRSGRRDEALALLLPAFRRKVFGLSYSFLRDREAAEDVTQEVFIKVWRALPGFDARASLSTWIYTIARNTSLSALRDRRGSGNSGDAAAPDAELASESGAAELAAENASLLRLIER